MGKDDSVVKSFRTTEEQFDRANEIFLKEGFNFSEVIRLLLDATIREGRIPRGIGTRETEEQADAAKIRNDYIDSILTSAIPELDGRTDSMEERLLDALFGGKKNASDMSNAELREWGDKWGMPDNLSAATLADLYNSRFFAREPWFGAYDYDTECESSDMEEMAVLYKFMNNLQDNISQVARKMQIKAVKTLMEYDNQKNGGF